MVGACILELLGMLGWGTLMYVLNISYTKYNIYIYIYIYIHIYGYIIKP